MVEFPRMLRSLSLAALPVVAIAVLSGTSPTSALPETPGRGATPEAAKISTRNGQPALFAPVMNDGEATFSLFAIDLDSTGGQIVLETREFGAPTSIEFTDDLPGVPITHIDPPVLEQGFVFASPPPDVHLVGFNTHGDTSFSPAFFSDPVFVDDCSAPFFANDFDFFFLNLDSSPLDTTLCGDTAPGNFIGCSSVNDIPTNGGAMSPVESGIGSCTDTPCMARVFPNAAAPLGCATARETALGMQVFQGFGAGRGADEFFLYGGKITFGNLSSTPGTVEVLTLAGASADFIEVGAFETVTHDLDSADDDPWNRLIFSDGFESGDTSAWSTSSDSPRGSGRVAGAPDGFRGISAADGGNSRAAVVFPLNSASVTAQLGAVNMGRKKARLAITYRDADGKKLGGKKRVTLKPNTFVELDLPGRLRDLVGAYADIKIKGKKSAVWPYARIEHAGSGDVTIVPGVVIG